METRIGKLKIFLGMCPGVGKTYAMLEYAHTLQRSGRQVAIGYLETHLRPETERMAEGLRKFPRKNWTYRGLSVEEMDLDRILEEHPEVCLVDELPHTNVEGMRHKKRYQDIEELLAEGIDVVTTVNIQHFDSVSDQVAALAGVRVSETVPLSFFMRADSIEVVDIAEEELMLRLKQGKIYLGHRGEAALNNFFKAHTLSALRELTFKLASQKLKSKSRHSLKNQAHIVVAISHSPHSRSLIQQTHQLAEQLGATFSAVYVQTSQLLKSSDQVQLKANLQLVENLGGQTHIAESDLVAESIVEHARSITASQLVMGRMPQRSGLAGLFSKPLLERIMALEPHLQVSLLTQDQWAHTRDKISPFNPSRIFQFSWLDWYSFCFVFGVTVISLIIENIIGYRAVGFLYLIVVMTIGVYGTLWATLFSALMSSLLWNLLFIPPRFTFIIHSHEDILMVLCYFIAALATGVLAYRLRAREKEISLREQKTRFLNSIFSLTSQSSLQALWPKLEQLLAQYFEGSFQLLNPEQIAKEVTSQTEENSTLLWSYDHAQPAGWSTETLSQSRSLFIPLKTNGKTYGVLRFKPHRRKNILAPAQKELLTTISAHFSMMLEKAALEKGETERLQQLEVSKIQSTLLNSVSHELRTPLAEIRGLSEVLSQSTHTHPNYKLLVSSTQRIQNVVDNLINMNRLSSSQTQLKKEWYLVEDLILEIQNTLVMGSNELKLVVEPDALIFCDVHFLRLALYNLIQNAERFAQPATTISIEFSRSHLHATLSVTNTGQPIAEADLPFIFDAFYRGQGQSSKGLGIGLAIVKQVAELHMGSLEAQNLKEPDRVVFSIRVPQPPYPEIPNE